MNLYEMAGSTDLAQAPPPRDVAFVLPGRQLHVLGEILRTGADRPVSILARGWVKTVHQAGSACDVFEARSRSTAGGLFALNIGRNS